MTKLVEHEVVDVDRWIGQFPIELYETKDGPRQFLGQRPDDPMDRWKASGTPITGPAHLARVEQVRRQMSREIDLGLAIPTDLIVWGWGEPAKPYLTKIGGVPYRPADEPWQGLDDYDPMTFFAQFCFADSRDILPAELPGDVMLVFFRDEESFYEAGDEEAVRIEWYNLEISKPLTARKCPKPSFPVPKLYGALHRTSDYPESEEAFRLDGHTEWYLFSTTQASRIGGTTQFIQNDPREKGESLLCTLNSTMPAKGEEYPFLGREKRLSPQEERRMQFLFGDVGCIYFLIDQAGHVRWTMDSY